MPVHKKSTKSLKRTVKKLRSNPFSGAAISSSERSAYKKMSKKKGAKKAKRKGY